MQLTEAVGAALGARYPLGPKSLGREPKRPISDPRGLKTRMDRIRGKFKSDREAAKAAGVPYSTWGHIAKGRRAPSQKTLDRITQAYGRLLTAPARALAVKRGPDAPSEWLIRAVVICQPGPDPTRHGPGTGGRSSRYANGHGSGLTREQARAVSGTEDLAFRTFRAEGLDSERIIGDWVTGGAEAATAALLDEIETAYTDEFGFEGDHVEVSFVG